MKKLLIMLLCVAMLTIGALASTGVQKITATLKPDITVIIDGETQTFKDANGDIVYPIIYEGTTYLPIRAIGNIMEKEVGWNESEQTITLTDIAKDNESSAEDKNTKTGLSYQSILDEYTIKLQNETPKLIQEYKDEAANNNDGLMGLATISMNKVTKLAEICTEGGSKMAEVMLSSGSGSYDEYEEWAGKLQEVYMTEAAKITDVYMESAK